MAKQIKDKLGVGRYRDLLGEIFRRVSGRDGKFFTPVHAALMCLPFKGYVTTNYDSGLLEARATVWPAVSVTGFSNWRQRSPLQAWYRGDIFQQEPCPVLFLHGIHQDPETFVLTTDEYAQLYDGGLVPRVLDRLWGQDSLVFVGFGFSDPWMSFLVKKGLRDIDSQDYGGPRHVAMLGFPSDKPLSDQIRLDLEANFDAEVVFYPVEVEGSGVGVREDHSALLELLRSVDVKRDPKRSRANRALLAKPARVAAHVDWVHESTNDERYVERHDALGRLNRWAADATVRMIAVTGMGGLGKTALIGHWLKLAGGLERRAYDGLLFWSFYADRSVGSFLARLVKFGEEKLSFPVAGQDAVVLDRALDLIDQRSVLLILDGLEVLQERPGGTDYGRLLEGALRRLLDAVCHHGAGLAILTSRFPFADLARHLGGGLRWMDLDRLTDQEGAAVLLRAGLKGASRHKLLKISNKLEGHPLGLRIFAAALAAKGEAALDLPIAGLFAQAGLSESQPIERKLGHILSFYEKHLPLSQARLLGTVSLFRTPMPEATVIDLAKRLPQNRALFEEWSDDAIRQELKGLRDQGLLIREPGAEKGDGCHPVLRDHFRRVQLDADRDAAGEVAELLTGRPSDEQPNSVGDIEPILAAIDFLLDANEFEPADQLYRSRLEDGQTFRSLPATEVGQTCALGFVADEMRQKRCVDALTERRLAFYLNEVGLLGMIGGDPRTALPWLESSLAVMRGLHDDASSSFSLQNTSELHLFLGQLGEAVAAADEAAELARKAKHSFGERNSMALRGYGQAMGGWLRAAVQDFDPSNEIEHQLYHRGFDGVWGVLWADALLRAGNFVRAQSVTEANLRHCENHQWLKQIARCQRLLGAVGTAESDLEDARRHLDQAEATMRSTQMLCEIPWVLIAQAELHRACGDLDESWRYAEEALQIAAPRELRLMHADALVLRGRIALDRVSVGSPDDADSLAYSAQDDSEAALRIARQCTYAWAERDALFLLADVSDWVGATNKALAHRKEAEALAQQLRWPA